MLQGFYSWSPSVLKKRVRTFVDERFYSAFPELKGQCSVIVSGSVAYGHYDEWSDIDLAVVLDRDATDEEKKRLKELKKRIAEEKEPVQFHPFEMFEQLQGLGEGWLKDTKIRDVATALVVDDARHQYAALQKSLRWYPKEIVAEKIQWLFAEAVFSLEERLSIAVRRRDPFMVGVAKLEVIRLASNALLLSRKRFPSFDKHLMWELGRLKQKPNGLQGLLKKLLAETNLKEIERLVRQLVRLVETDLEKRHFIKKEPPAFWLNLRPAHKVTF